MLAMRNCPCSMTVKTSKNIAQRKDLARMAREEVEGEKYLARMAPTIQHNIAHTKLYSYHKTNTHHVAYHSDSDSDPDPDPDPNSDSN